jgi:hypothetical protein
MTEPLAPTTIGERQALADLREQAEKAADALLMDVLGDSYSDTTLRVATDHIVSFVRKHPLATPTTNAPVAETAPDKLREMLLAVEDFINEPQRNRDIEPMEVRDYRHELYRKWSPLCQAILALRQTLPIHGEMREALEEFCLSAECAAGVDEGADQDTASSYIMSAMGSAMAVAYDRARNALTSNTGSSS